MTEWPLLNWISWFDLAPASGTDVAQLFCMCRPKTMTFLSPNKPQIYHIISLSQLTHSQPHRPSTSIHLAVTPFSSFPKLINHKSITKPRGAPDGRAGELAKDALGK